MSKLALKPILGEAWKQVYGSKRSFLALGIAVGIIELISAGLQQEAASIFVKEGKLTTVLAFMIVSLIVVPLLTGFYMFGVRRARGETIHPKEGFQYYKKIVPLFIAQVLSVGTVWIIMYGVSYISIGILAVGYNLHKFAFLSIVILVALFFLVAGISLFALFSFVQILVIDQNKSPWQAYKTSVKMALPYLKTLVIADIFFSILNILALIPLGLGLLWTLPFAYITIGVFYREIMARQVKTTP
jgi:hypothetical protein